MLCVVLVVCCTCVRCLWLAVGGLLLFVHWCMLVIMSMLLFVGSCVLCVMSWLWCVVRCSLRFFFVCVVVGCWLSVDVCCLVFVGC